MNEEDFKRIEEIANTAAKNAQHSLVKKTIVEVFKAYGIHDPEQMQKRMGFVDVQMDGRKALRRGFLDSIGSHAATIIITLGAGWFLLKGVGG